MTSQRATIIFFLTTIILLLYCPTEGFRVTREQSRQVNNQTLTNRTSPNQNIPNIDHGSSEAIEDTSHTHHKTVHGTSLIGWRLAEVEPYLVISIFFLSAALAKIAYHHLVFIHSHVPESCVLIILGTVIGVVYHGLGVQEHVPFNSSHFFFLLLPPIILESAYSLHDKAFFYNIQTILLYAVVGTLINVGLIGVSLYGLDQAGLFESDINLIECFTFSTIISAVDPVAVLAIFHEIGVNKSLYFLVFGESLLNDAVVVVLYSTVTTFAALPVISGRDIIIGILSFFTVSGGGLLIGILIGTLTALITKTTQSLRVVEPFVVIIMAYVSYVIAELFHLSGIISLIACGLVQYEYIADNIAPDSLTTIKYFTKTMSSISDVIIFFYLGRVLVRDDHTWSSSFVGFSTLFCVVYRFVSIFLLTAVANRTLQPLRRINFAEQFLMAYGGLRGAIAFSLAISLNSEYIKNSQLFVTTSLFIILFTVFFLGSTTKPVIKWLNVKLHQGEEKTMFTEINDRVVDSLMSGIEEISGVTSVHSVTLKFHRINENILKRLLTRGDMHSFKHTFEAVRWNSVRRSKRHPPHRPNNLSGVAPAGKPSMTTIDLESARFSVSTTTITNKTPFAEEEEDDVFFQEPLSPVITLHREDSMATTRSAESPARPHHQHYVRNISANNSRHHLPHLPVFHHLGSHEMRNRRRSTLSGRRVVNTMFSQSSFYHLPRRDSIVNVSPSPPETMPPASARSYFSFFSPTNLNIPPMAAPNPPSRQQSRQETPQPSQQQSTQTSQPPPQQQTETPKEPYINEDTLQTSL